MSGVLRKGTGREETNLVVSDRAKHILEKALELILAFGIEEGDDTGDKRGANVLVAIRIAKEGVWFVEAGDGSKLSMGVGEAGSGGGVGIVVEGSGVGERAETGLCAKVGDRGWP